MKEIRLEFPLNWEKDSKSLFPSRVWLKVVGNRTEAFRDKNFLWSFPKADNVISLDVNVPDELKLIEVIPPKATTSTSDIDFDFIYRRLNSNLALPELKKVSFIFNDSTFDFPLFNEVNLNILLKGFSQKISIDKWVLIVYTMKSETIATFHWDSKLKTK